MNGTIETGIPALDRMLGGKGLPHPSIVLLRGGPGSGKTTLALQIIASHLRSDNPKGYAAFVSLEADPERTIEYANATFELGIPTTPSAVNAVNMVSRRELQGALTSRSAGGRPDLLGALAECVLGEVACLLVDHRHPLPTKGLIVIDSLNLLAEMGTVKGRWRRSVIHHVCSELRPLGDQMTVLLIAEYDPTSPRRGSVAAESFFSDVEIQLGPEPVVREMAEIPSEMRARGGLPKDWKQPVPHTPEARSFCRVIKSRTSNRQARRCAYDIVSGSGLVFYETYPGDGQMMLFAENISQRREWEDFFATDISQLYPALRFDMFGRTGLQRTFASLRRFRQIPERTELYLSSFDTYWINWYRELFQRYDLALLLGKQLPCKDQPGNGAQFALIVGRAHRRLAESLLPGANPPNCANLAQEIDREICARCKRPATCGIEDIARALEAAWTRLSNPQQEGGLLHAIPEGKLKLFGDRQSPIIHELDEDVRKRGELPVFRRAKPSVGTDLFAIPYNANVGMLVCRTDLLKRLLGTGEEAINDDQLADRIERLHKDKVAAVGEFLKLLDGQEPPPVEKDEDRTLLSQEDRTLLREIAKKMQADGAARQTALERIENLRKTRIPTTWEEVIALCMGPANPDTEQAENGDEAKYHFLIETRTFDTQLCTLLEWVWGVGGNLRVWPDYRVENKAETVLRLFEAFWIYRQMRLAAVVPRNSTLEAFEFGQRYSQGCRPDWLFARHWHSTFVDILSAKRPSPQDGPAWTPPEGTALEVARIPVALSRYLSSPHAKPEDLHASCWGEWYLAFLKGSENETLGVDLINNLKSSRKVCERAFSCAALPTVEEFYSFYGDIECFNIPKRRDVSLPKITFSEVREYFFRTAKTRTEVFDYRHCMRHLHAILEMVHDFPERMSAQRLGQEVVAAVARIEELGTRGILLDR